MLYKYIDNKDTLALLRREDLHFQLLLVKTRLHYKMKKVHNLLYIRIQYHFLLKILYLLYHNLMSILLGTNIQRCFCQWIRHILNLGYRSRNEHLFDKMFRRFVILLFKLIQIVYIIHHLPKSLLRLLILLLPPLRFHPNPNPNLNLNQCYHTNLKILNHNHIQYSPRLPIAWQ